MDNSNYYIINKDRMIKSTHGLIKSMEKVLIKYYDKKFTNDVINNVNLNFEELLPNLPYIGGMDNLLTKQIVNTAPLLALYKVLKSKEIETAQIGKIICEANIDYWNSYPKIAGLLFRIYLGSKAYLKTLKSSAEQSQQRRYVGDFVFSAVDGEKGSFDYGIDYYECGICKYFHEHGADEIMPYICLSDFASSDAFRTGLIRTKTIAEGNEKCDFRFKIGKSVERDLSNYFK